MNENSLINTKTVLIFLAGILLGFAVGFALANSVNRQEQDKLRAGQSNTSDATANSQTASGKKSQAAAGDENSIPTLTDEQLKNAFAKADQKPADAALQKQVGQAMYVYAWEKSNTAILPDVSRVLK